MLVAYITSLLVFHTRCNRAKASWNFSIAVDRPGNVVTGLIFGFSRINQESYTKVPSGCLRTGFTGHRGCRRACALRTAAGRPAFASVTCRATVVRLIRDRHTGGFPAASGGAVRETAMTTIRHGDGDGTTPASEAHGVTPRVFNEPGMIFGGGCGINLWVSCGKTLACLLPPSGPFPFRVRRWRWRWFRVTDAGHDSCWGLMRLARQRMEGLNRQGRPRTQFTRTARAVSRSVCPTGPAAHGSYGSGLVEKASDQRVEIPRTFEMNRMCAGGHDREADVRDCPPQRLDL